MKEDTRWKIIAGLLLVTLTLAMLTAHYLIFHDEQHLFIYFAGDLAFLPVEVLVVTLIIDQMLESRDKQQRMEKLNMVIGTFFSRIGTPLLENLVRSDPAAGTVQEYMTIGTDWQSEKFRDIQQRLSAHPCHIAIDRVDLGAMRIFIESREDFLLRLVENPMVLEHETFTDLIFAVNHLGEELKVREDLSHLPPSDMAHLSNDICRVYSHLVPEWLKYMEYLKIHYPYLFSLAIRRNPYDPLASVIIREG